MDRNLRDGILFAAGLLGTVHETVVALEPREVLIVMFAAMMGLPLFLRSDERTGGPPGEEAVDRFKKLTLEEFEQMLEQHDRRVRARIAKQVKSYPRTIVWVATCAYVSSLVALAHL